MLSQPQGTMDMLTDLPVVYQDQDLLVLNKPSGLLSVPGKGADKQDCLSAWAQAQVAQACVVHRLDMGTSGLMVMALNATSQRSLNHAFATRAVVKRYEAIVTGQPVEQPAHGQDWTLIDLPLALDWPRRPLRVVDIQHGKPSQTLWRRLRSQGSYSLLELQPRTGRSHQIRVHLQAIGHPIVGDALYAPDTVAQAANRLLLHASELCLAHPVQGHMMRFSCPSGFEKRLQSLD